MCHGPEANESLPTRLPEPAGSGGQMRNWGVAAKAAGAGAHPSPSPAGGVVLDGGYTEHFRRTVLSVFPA